MIRVEKVMHAKRRFAFVMHSTSLRDKAGDNKTSIIINQAQVLKIVCKRAGCRQDDLLLHFTCTNRTACSVCICLIHTGKDWTCSDGAGHKTILHHKTIKTSNFYTMNTCDKRLLEIVLLLASTFRY